ncbi:MAG: HEAT repeat domain-containing protein [bacterium]|nr:HEAT repeat domain-containing protein [bacterium]
MRCSPLALAVAVTSLLALAAASPSAQRQHEQDTKDLAACVREILEDPTHLFESTAEKLIALGPEAAPAIGENLGTYRWPGTLLLALERLKNPEALPWVLDYAEREGGPVFRALTLAEYDDPRAEGELLDIFETGWGDHDHPDELIALRIEVAGHLGRLGDPDTRRRMHAYLFDEDLLSTVRRDHEACYQNYCVAACSYLDSEAALCYVERELMACRLDHVYLAMLDALDGPLPDRLQRALLQAETDCRLAALSLCKVLEQETLADPDGMVRLLAEKRRVALNEQAPQHQEYWWDRQVLDWLERAIDHRLSASSTTTAARIPPPAPEDRTIDALMALLEDASNDPVLRLDALERLAGYPESVPAEGLFREALALGRGFRHWCIPCETTGRAIKQYTGIPLDEPYPEYHNFQRAKELTLRLMERRAAESTTTDGQVEESCNGSDVRTQQATAKHDIPEIEFGASIDSLVELGSDTLISLGQERGWTAPLVEALARLECREATPYIVEYLDNGGVPWVCIPLLRALEDPRAEASLLTFMRNEDKSLGMRLLAAGALARVGGSEARQAANDFLFRRAHLESARSDYESTYHCYCIAACSFESEEAFRFLEDELSDPCLPWVYGDMLLEMDRPLHPRVRVALMNGLDSVLIRDEPLSAFRGIVKLLGQKECPDIDRLARILARVRNDIETDWGGGWEREFDWLERALARRMASRTTVGAAITGPQWRDRADVLATVGDTPVLAGMLEGPDQRIAVLRALGRTTPPDALPSVRSFLESRDARSPRPDPAAVQAIATLGAYEDAVSLPVLEGLYRDETVHVAKRVAAAGAALHTAGANGADDARALLLRLVRDPERLGPDDLPTEVLAVAACSTGQGDGLSFALETLGRDDVDVRTKRAIVAALPPAPQESTIDPLMALVREPLTDDELQLDALERLLGYAPPIPLEPLAEAAKELRRSAYDTASDTHELCARTAKAIEQYTGMPLDEPYPGYHSHQRALRLSKELDIRLASESAAGNAQEEVE